MIFGYVSRIVITAILRFAMMLCTESAHMKLFKRTGKATEKWRTSARMIDLHKTKVIIIHAQKARQPQAQRLPPWIYERLLNGVPQAPMSVEKAPENRNLARKVCNEQAHTKLMQQFGLA